MPSFSFRAEEMIFRPEVELRNWWKGAGGTKEDISRPTAAALLGAPAAVREYLLGRKLIRPR